MDEIVNGMQDIDGRFSQTEGIPKKETPTQEQCLHGMCLREVQEESATARPDEHGSCGGQVTSSIVFYSAEQKCLKAMKQSCQCILYFLVACSITDLIR